MTDAPDILLPRPHRNQAAVLDSPTRWKLINCGGRFGKTRLALIGGTLGHGPRQADGTPLRRGVAQGGMVAWVAPDYPQSRAIWQEEILPRFGGKAHLGVEVRETERQVRFPGGGFWEIRSAESIDALRGHQWDGVIFDEASHIDLQYAWEQVVSLRLTDRAGWAMFPSTPNGGLDGNADKMIPSYFNRLCLKAVAGELDPDWGYWHFTTRDNPHLPVEEVDRLYRVTDPTSMKYRQEMQAELVMGGGGLAFPEWTPEVHVRAPWPDETLREGWRWYAGLDWGYSAKGVYTLHCFGPEARVHVRWDYAFERLTPEQAVTGIVARHRAKGFPFPLMIGCDSAMQQRSGVRSVWEAFSEAWTDALGQEAKRSPLVPVAKTGVDGRGHRESRKLMTHELLAFTAQPDGTVRPWDEPRLTFHPEARECITSIPRLMQSPIPGQEDVDTTGPDHAWDSCGYCWWLRPQGVPGVPREPDRHQLVLDAAGHRVPRGRVAVAVGERGYGVRRLRAGRTPDTL